MQACRGVRKGFALFRWLRELTLTSCLLAVCTDAAIVDDPIHSLQVKRLHDVHRFAPPARLSIPGNLVQNDDFDLGLTHWVATGDVIHASAEAILGDADPASAILHQVVSTGPGDFIVAFDYRQDVSMNVEPGFAPDTFFASLYFFNDENTFDLSGNVFDDTLALMDLDKDGAFNHIGTITPSAAKGAGWWHFAATFNTSYGFVAVAFELAGLNGEAGDSQMFIDNVLIIPEPGTVWLLAGSMALLLARRKWRGRN